jgi:hypothetical protein
LVNQRLDRAAGISDSGMEPFTSLQRKLKCAGHRVLELKLRMCSHCLIFEMSYAAGIAIAQFEVLKD